MASNQKARYLVGIDLGTTNTVVAFCENTSPLADSKVELFHIDQLIGQGEVARRPQLPSFRFHAAPNQFDAQSLQLPWEHQRVEGDLANPIIGEWARELGTSVEGRQVSSAKSWLSHQQVDREGDILPWTGGEDVEKVSPLIASASYLNHIRQSWNHRNPINRLEDQEVVVTVPASFDETARNLTLKAAQLAGLGEVLLLEEPQAACYDWYGRHLDQDLSDLPLMLICDVGGGTTDLSLIQASYDHGDLSLSRIGVGEHLMLGGDNIDLALAHMSERELNGNKPMKAGALSKLIQQTRRVKESLLSKDAPEQGKVTLLGGGSRLIGGSRSVHLSKDQVRQVGLEGFFPKTGIDVLPDSKRSAMVEFGLPYVSDPAVTKHIAQFLAQHRSSCQDALKEDGNAIPVALLVNGGAFNSDLIKQRLVEVMQEWRGEEITLLDNPHPDYAVAYGAVAYSKARRGAQLKIGGGSPRSYFLHLQGKGNKSQALCLLQKGAEEEQEVRLTGRRFALTLDQPVRFNLLTTTVDQLNDGNKPQNGSLHPIDEEQMLPLPPYVASLNSDDETELAQNQKRKQEVQLSCRLTEVGTLKLECVSIDDDQRWQVEFEVRHGKRHETKELSPKVKDACELISSLYSGNKKQTDAKAIKLLSKQLEKSLGKRENWDLATSRALFDTFALGRKRRRRSDQHEKNWLRLAGYSLRPGFGDAVDGWRMDQVWPLYQQGIQFKSQQSWSDWWIFWRRISGGLNQEQQEEILADIAKYLHPGMLKNPKSAETAHQNGYEAMVRLSASLEHLHYDDKVLLGTWFLTKAINFDSYKDAHWWALARLASRRLCTAVSIMSSHPLK